MDLSRFHMFGFPMLKFMGILALTGIVVSIAYWYFIQGGI